MTSGKVLAGVFAGIAIGATLGILLAPDKGSVTRKKISDKGIDYKDTLMYLFYELMDTVKEKSGAFKEEGNNIVNQGKTKFDDATEAIKQAVA